MTGDGVEAQAEFEDLFRVPPPTTRDSRGRWYRRVPRRQPPNTGVALLALMQAYPCHAFTAPQLAKELGRSRDCIRQRLLWLMRAGRLHRIERGRYVVAERTKP